MKKQTYIAGVDGLRAIAVVSVLLFHVGIRGFDGGFVGVDIFFVISGFLITRLIVDELERSGDFSFSNFYIRRARHLFPALFVILILSFVFLFYCSRHNISKGLAGNYCMRAFRSLISSFGVKPGTSTLTRISNLCYIRGR